MISYLTKLNISLLLRASGHPELEILIQEERERRRSEGAGCIHNNLFVINETTIIS